MKNSVSGRFIFFILCLAFTIVAVCPSGPQAGKKSQSLIPEDIYNILQKSCIPCHSSHGGRLPRAMVNFSKWNVYSEDKKAEKASKIFKAVKDGTMPPVSVKEKNPQMILTKEEVGLICNWADSFRREKKVIKKTASILIKDEDPDPFHRCLVVLNRGQESQAQKLLAANLLFFSSILSFFSP